MMPLLHAVLTLGGGVDPAESFRAPTAFVVLYGLGWLALLGVLVWLTTRQHGLNRSILELGDELQARLDRDDPPDKTD